MNNQILKVCVMIDILPNSGGGFHLAKKYMRKYKKSAVKKY